MSEGVVLLPLSGDPMNSDVRGAIRLWLFLLISIMSFPPSKIIRQVELMNSPVRFAEYDTTVTPHVFFNEIYSSFSLLGFIKGYTIGLPGKIIGLFRSEEEVASPLITEVERDSVLSLSKEQMETVDKMRNRLAVSVDEETGVSAGSRHVCRYRNKRLSFQFYSR